METRQQHPLLRMSSRRRRLSGALVAITAAATLTGALSATASPMPTGAARVPTGSTSTATLDASPTSGALPAATGDVIWRQEFDGPAGSAPDPSVWNHETGNHGWGNNELENYTTSRSNSALDGQGNLVITARREADGSYTSARMTTKDKYEVQYGRIEARIQIPRGQGIWPAFWMLGAGFPETEWPASGEIDIMENVGKTPHLVHGTVHGPGYSGGAGITAAYQHPQGWSFADTFHTFSIDWKPGTITWYVDGQQYHQVTRSSLGGKTWVFDQAYFFILNVAVGGGWPGNPDSTTQFPQQMKVDYIRVYDNGSTTGNGGGSGSGSLPTGTGQIRLGGTMCMDVPWGQTHDGNQIQVAKCSTNNAQRWTRGQDGTIRALGKCLDVLGGGTGNGTVVQLYRCNNTAAQQWVYDAPTRTLRNPQSGKCLDGVGGTPVHDGQKLSIWDCYGAANQQWTF